MSAKDRTTPVESHGTPYLADRRITTNDRRTQAERDQALLDEADRRHRERRQYAENPSGWTPLPLGPLPPKR